jgi:hypothetical protein
MHIERNNQKYFSLVFLLACVLTPSYLHAQTSPEIEDSIIVVSNKVGEIIDAEEREKYLLFPQIKNFDTMIFYKNSDGNYVKIIGTAENEILISKSYPTSEEEIREIGEFIDNYVDSETEIIMLREKQKKTKKEYLDLLEGKASFGITVVFGYAVNKQSPFSLVIKECETDNESGEFAVGDNLGIGLFGRYDISSLLALRLDLSESGIIGPSEERGGGMVHSFKSDGYFREISTSLLLKIPVITGDEKLFLHYLGGGIGIYDSKFKMTGTFHANGLETIIDSMGDTIVVDNLIESFQFDFKTTPGFHLLYGIESNIKVKFFLYGNAKLSMIPIKTQKMTYSSELNGEDSQDLSLQYTWVLDFDYKI